MLMAFSCSSTRKILRTIKHITVSQFAKINLIEKLPRNAAKASSNNLKSVKSTKLEHSKRIYSCHITVFRDSEPNTNGIMWPRI